MGKKRDLLIELKYRKLMYRWEKQRYRDVLNQGENGNADKYELEKSLSYIKYLTDLKNNKGQE